jgi:hypothetical protein
MGTTRLIGEVCRAVLRYWKPDMKKAMGDDTHRLSSISHVGTHKECRRVCDRYSGHRDVVGSVRDFNVRIADLSQSHVLARGTCEGSWARWFEDEACRNMAILAGRKRPCSCYWPRNRHFVGGVRTLPTIIHTVEGSGGIGGSHVVDFLVVAQACLFPAHLNVGTHKCGGDRPDKVVTLRPGDSSGACQSRNYHQNDAKLTHSDLSQVDLPSCDVWLCDLVQTFVL